MSIDLGTSEFLCTLCDSAVHIQSSSRYIQCPECHHQLQNPLATPEISVRSRSRSPRRAARNERQDSTPPSAVVGSPDEVGPISLRMMSNLARQFLGQSELESAPTDFNSDDMQGDSQGLNGFHSYLDIIRMELLASRATGGLGRFSNRAIRPWLSIHSQDTESDLSFSTSSFRLLDLPRRVRASKKELVKKITTTRLTEHLDSTCAICLSDYKASQKASELPCKHLFHKSCLWPWLKQAESCPVCRRPILQ
jgi:DNA-directed RNA polymerase subunit RPC12/RpoP